ncbi:MAG: rod shape-determining protein MreD [Janthinobacterium lividum]
MSRPQYILLPASASFIVFSLAAAFLLNLLPWGHLDGVPDFVALTLLFWSLHQPRRVGMGAAFAMGLLMDVHNASFLGEHPLGYLMLAFVAITFHRRILGTPLLFQMIFALPILALAQIVPLLVRLAMGAGWPGWGYLASAVVATLIWPLVSALLIAPQKRAVDPDDTRPI